MVPLLLPLESVSSLSELVDSVDELLHACWRAGSRAAAAVFWTCDAAAGGDVAAAAAVAGLSGGRASGICMGSPPTVRLIIRSPLGSVVMRACLGGTGGATDGAVLNMFGAGCNGYVWS